MAHSAVGLIRPSSSVKLGSDGYRMLMHFDKPWRWDDQALMNTYDDIVEEEAGGYSSEEYSEDDEDVGDEEEKDEGAMES